MTSSSERAAQCLAYMAKFSARREKLKHANPLPAIPADVDKARALIEAWRREYNEERPKNALGGMTPTAYAKHLAEVRL